MLFFRTLYLIKDIYKKIFLYPTTELDVSKSNNYDEYWKDKRGVSLGTLSAWQKDRSEYVLSILAQNTKQIELADIGCGDGSILVYLRSKLKNISHCTGYDNSVLALTNAKEAGIETHVLDISRRDLYVSLKEVDYYLLLETLEHIPYSEELLLQAITKARVGVFFSFPNSGYITHRLRLLFGKFPLQWRLSPNEHVRFWTRADLIWWLKAMNINQYQIFYYRGIPFINKIFPGLCAAGFVVYAGVRDDHE